MRSASSSVRSWCGVAVLLGLAAPAPAARYSFKHYLQDSGLTNLAVNTLAQDRDGFLWVATDNGLFRYNGRRFQRFGRQDGLPQDDVTALTVSIGGTVWAGTSGGVAYSSGAKFVPVPKDLVDSVAQGRLAAAGENTVYAGTGHGLVRLTIEHGAPSVRRVFTGETFGVAADREGSVWFGCGPHLCRYDGRSVSVGASSLGLPDGPWENIVVDPAGSLWVRSESRLYELPVNGPAFVERDAGLPPSPGSLSEMKPDPVYGVMVPTHAGLAIPEGGGWRVISERNGLTSDAVATAMRDREGSIWIGFRGSGVDRWLGEGEWENWTKADGLTADVLWGMAKDDQGRLWVASTENLTRVDRSTGEIKAWNPGKSLRRPMTVVPDGTGRIWIAHAGGVARLNPKTSALDRYGAERGLGIDRPRRVLLDPDGSLWVMGAGGVYRSGDVRREPVLFSRQNLPFEPERPVYNDAAFDEDGCFWIASNHGLYRRAGGRWLFYTEKDGLEDAAVYGIAVSNGAVWVCYRSPLGITVISNPHGKWGISRLNASSGLPSNMIYALGSSGGTVWAGTDSGVLRFLGTAWRRYSQVDGLVWDDCDSYGILAEERGVWIATSRGLSHFTPDASGHVAAGLRPPFLRPTGALVLPWSARQFSIAWDNLNYREEVDLSYQFRLNGGSQWVSTTEMSASFPNLPAGDYTFEVHSAGAGGARSADAVLGFRILAPWWGTLLFRSAAAGGLILVIVLAWRYQSARLLRDKRKLELAVDLRTRELGLEKARAEAERERAEAASRHKGEFLANMSHEIRTPLNGIIGMAELLLATRLDPEQSECTRMVIECGQHLLSVITDILDYSKIEAGFIRLESSPFDLREAIALVADIVGPQARSKGLSLAVDYDESLTSCFEGDAGRVRQIVVNFAANAIKFTEHGTIGIRVRRAGPPGDFETVRVEVSDSGCGIPEGKIGSLFQQFVQVDGSSTRRHGGTGLGLAISRRLAEMMGGSVGVVSDPGKGSTFWAELRLKRSQTQPQPEAPPRRILAPLSRPLRVLVAEDNLVNQKVLTRILERLGCEFRVTGNGAQAVESYSEGSFDVVLMDCQMPVCDGYEATGAIRKAEAEAGRPRVPIIALTAHAGDADRDRCLAAGMDDYLTKPTSAERLREVLCTVASPAPAARSAG